ncbi:MAG: hypothetical protein ACD_79C00182G0010 [uncultured bacterium]|nr:MAG: hypothetical protein ACD_79C00182G0010 [uncultured bacterium]
MFGFKIILHNQNYHDKEAIKPRKNILYTATDKVLEVVRFFKNLTGLKIFVGKYLSTEKNEKTEVLKGVGVKDFN